jgi:NAD(P)-dependent dehydrogenase (short-subunit alcohol dehydrogenase family)
VVTGASTGIGYATTLALAGVGYDVFAGVRSLSAGEPRGPPREPGHYYKKGQDNDRPR